MSLSPYSTDPITLRLTYECLFRPRENNLFLILFFQTKLILFPLDTLTPTYECLYRPRENNQFLILFFQTKLILLLLDTLARIRKKQQHFV